MSAACRAAAALVLAATAVACGAADTDGPPELRLGIDECSRCRMIVSEPSTAAVARGAGGREARFDDLACLTAFAAGDRAGGWQAWVRTLDAEGWVAAQDVLFMRHPRRITPMGSGLVAFRLPPADPAGELTGWEQLIRTAGEETTDDTQ